jgi:hypothetical protein
MAVAFCPEEASRREMVLVVVIAGVTRAKS